MESNKSTDSVISMKDIKFSIFHNFLEIEYIGNIENINPIKLLVKKSDEVHKVVDLEKENKFKLEELVIGIENPCRIKLSIIVENIDHKVVIGDICTFIGAENLIIKKVDLNIKNEQLYINTLGNGFDIEKYELAYYLLSKGRIIRKFLYPQEPNINIPLKENGEYSIKIFVRNKNTQEKTSFKSELIKYEKISSKKEFDNLINDNWKLRKELILDKENLYAALEKETNLLLAYKKVSRELANITKKYNALKSSKLGRLTLKYWQWKKSGVKRNEH